MKTKLLEALLQWGGVFSPRSPEEAPRTRVEAAAFGSFSYVHLEPMRMEARQLSEVKAPIKGRKAAFAFGVICGFSNL